jgi:hypothetical protein
MKRVRFTKGQSGYRLSGAAEAAIQEAIFRGRALRGPEKSLSLPAFRPPLS